MSGEPPRGDREWIQRTIDRATALRAVSRSEEAVRCIREALAAAPDDWQLLWTLSSAELSAGLIADSIAHGEAALAQRPGSPILIRHLANVLRHDPSSTERATSLALEAVSAEPDSDWSHIVVGETMLVAGDFARARTAAEQALTIDATSVAARNILVRVAIFDGALEQAREIASGLVADQPGDAASLTNLADVLRRTDAREQAGKFFSDAAGIAPASRAGVRAAAVAHGRGWDELLAEVAGPHLHLRLADVAARLWNGGEEFLASCVRYEHAHRLMRQGTVPLRERHRQVLRMVHRALAVDWRATPEVAAVEGLPLGVATLRGALQLGGEPIRREFWICMQTYATKVHTWREPLTPSQCARDLRRAALHAAAARAAAVGSAAGRAAECDLALGAALAAKSNEPRKALPLLESASHWFARWADVRHWVTSRVLTGSAWSRLLAEDGVDAIDRSIAACESALALPDCKGLERGSALMTIVRTTRQRFTWFWDASRLDTADASAQAAAEAYAGWTRHVSRALTMRALVLLEDPRPGRVRRHDMSVELLDRARELAPAADHPFQYASATATLAHVLRLRSGGRHAADRLRAAELAETAFAARPRTFQRQVLALCLVERKEPPLARDIARALELLRAAVADAPEDESAVDRLGLRWDLGRVLRAAGTAIDPLLGVEAATVLERALSDTPMAISPRMWAEVARELGHAHADLRTGDRRRDLRTAIDRYRQVLDLFDRSQDPWSWAGLQADLARAHTKLAEEPGVPGARAEALRRADAALEVVTPADDPDLLQELLELRHRSGAGGGHRR